MPKKIEERKFVAFGVAAIDTDLIVSVVSAVQKINGVKEEVIAIILETGTKIVLSTESKDIFMFWWIENIKNKGFVEKAELPASPIPLSAPVEPVPVTSPAPVSTPATVKPVESVEPIPSIVSGIANKIAPTPPPTDRPVKPPLLSDIGKT